MAFDAEIEDMQARLKSMEGREWDDKLDISNVYAIMRTSDMVLHGEVGNKEALELARIGSDIFCHNINKISRYYSQVGRRGDMEELFEICDRRYIQQHLESGDPEKRFLVGKYFESRAFFQEEHLSGLKVKNDNRGEREAEIMKKAADKKVRRMLVGIRDDFKKAAEIFEKTSGHEGGVGITLHAPFCREEAGIAEKALGQVQEKKLRV